MRQLAPVVFLLDVKNKMTQEFGDEGVEKGARPFDKLRETLAKTSSRHGREVP